MRALGPGSVSSLLKVGLDLVYFVLWVALAGLIIAVFASIVVIPLIPLGGDLNVNINGETDPEVLRRLIRGPVIPLALAALSLYMAALVVIIGRLRQVFATLTRGDPFQPLNVSRLRMVGVMLICIEFWNFLVPPLLRRMVPGDLADDAQGRLSLTGWFSILVVFVLAEVFREGARLRREAELTI